MRASLCGTQGALMSTNAPSPRSLPSIAARAAGLLSCITRAAVARRRRVRSRLRRSGPSRSIFLARPVPLDLLGLLLVDASEPAACFRLRLEELVQLRVNGLGVTML